MENSQGNKNCFSRWIPFVVLSGSLRIIKCLNVMKNFRSLNGCECNYFRELISLHFGHFLKISSIIFNRIYLFSFNFTIIQFMTVYNPLFIVLKAYYSCVRSRYFIGGGNCWSVVGGRTYAGSRRISSGPQTLV